MKTTFLFFILRFLRKLCSLCNDAQSYGIARHFIDDKLIERAVIRTQTVMIVNS